MDCCLDFPGMGALPDLDWCGSQKWQSSSSFSELELTESGSDTWLGCELLLEPMEDPLEEEYSSKLLSQEFGLSQPLSSASGFKGFYNPTLPALLEPAAATVPAPGHDMQGCSADTSDTSTEGSLQMLPVPAALPSTPTSTLKCAPSPAAAIASGMALQLQQQTSSTLSPLEAVAHHQALAAAPTAAPDYSDADAVRLVALALQMSQGDPNAAMTQLLTWAAAGQ